MVCYMGPELPQRISYSAVSFNMIDAYEYTLTVSIEPRPGERVSIAPFQPAHLECLSRSRNRSILLLLLLHTFFIMLDCLAQSMGKKI